MGKIAILFFVLGMFVSVLKAEETASGVYVFGDSLVDVGNNNYLPISIAKADFPHNGVDFSTKLPTGRFCNGKNAADFIADKLGLPAAPPYLSLLKKEFLHASLPLTGISFASGGAGIFNGSDQVLGQSITFSTQIDYYISVYSDMVKELGSPAAQAHISKSIFPIVIGSNDLLDYSGKTELQKKNTPQQYKDLMIAALKNQLKRLYDNGARKLLLTGVGPIGCIPVQRVKIPTKDCNDQLNSWAVLYNEGLKQMLADFKDEFQDITYSYIDVYSFMMAVIQNPTPSGFNEVRAACCGLGELKAKVPCVPISSFCPDRTNHLWWDLFHPTQAAVGMLVDTIFHGSSQYTHPMNLQQLVLV